MSQSEELRIASVTAFIAWDGEMPNMEAFESRISFYSKECYCYLSPVLSELTLRLITTESNQDVSACHICKSSDNYIHCLGVCKHKMLVITLLLLLLHYYWQKHLSVVIMQLLLGNALGESMRALFGKTGRERSRGKVSKHGERVQVG